LQATAQDLSHIIQVFTQPLQDSFQGSLQAGFTLWVSLSLAGIFWAHKSTFLPEIRRPKPFIASTFFFH
jgi:hypothetical protein